MIDIKRAVTTLASQDVDFVIIGGVALSLHSAAYVTYDIDVCYSRSSENLRKLAEALRPYKPRLRGFPKDLPFFWDAATIRDGTSFMLDTDLDDFDMLGEVSGIGSFEDVAAASTPWSIFGYEVRVLSVDGLIAAKEAAGREKDVPGLKILYALRESTSYE